MTKISYAITICDELNEINRLVKFLLNNKRREDDICILLDKPKASPELLDQLYKYSSANWITLKESTFQGHFADWKNELTEMCTGDYIFNIDADELPVVSLIHIIPQILESNDVDVILVPRVNTVEGLTQEHINTWRWRVDPRGWINFPDYQWRIYKNTPDITWTNKVHEVLTGYKTISELPADPEYALVHNKTIERQEKQNNYYNTL
jgi:hypothetical protein